MFDVTTFPESVLTSHLLAHTHLYPRRAKTKDLKLLRVNYQAAQLVTETPEEKLKRQRLHTRSITRKLFDASDFQGHLRTCLHHISTDAGCGCVIGDAAFVTALVSRYFASLPAYGCNMSVRLDKNINGGKT
jgi:hypothetical protein